MTSSQPVFSHTVNPGQPIRAQDYNVLAAAIFAMAGRSPGAGNLGEGDLLIPCVIEEVHAPTLPPDAEHWPRQGEVTYTVHGVHHHFRLVEHTPELGRPYAAEFAAMGRIVPAAKGSPCYVLRVPRPSGSDAETAEPMRPFLFILDERPAVRVCSTGTSGASQSARAST